MQSRCIGSFRLATSTPHLHGNFNFTKSILETAKQSLRHSCTSEFTRQGISLPQDRQSYGRRLLGFIFKAYTLFHFTFQHRAGVRPYTSSYDLAESCVFSKQSPLQNFLQPFKKASFIPKLQDHFAEFLQYSSLKRLSIFYLTTCVGLGYGFAFYTVSWNIFINKRLIIRKI